MKERYSKHDFKSMKVFKIWNVSPQDMLDEIIRIDKQCHDNPSEQYKPTFYIGKSLEYIREVYSQYLGLESLTEDEQIENGYYRLEIL